MTTEADDPVADDPERLAAFLLDRLARSWTSHQLPLGPFADELLTTACAALVAVYGRPGAAQCLRIMADSIPEARIGLDAMQPGGNA